MELWFENAAIICNQNKMKKFINNKRRKEKIQVEKKTTVLIPRNPRAHISQCFYNIALIFMASLYIHPPFYVHRKTIQLKWSINFIFLAVWKEMIQYKSFEQQHKSKTNDQQSMHFW